MGDMICGCHCCCRCCWWFVFRFVIVKWLLLCVCVFVDCVVVCE